MNVPRIASTFRNSSSVIVRRDLSVMARHRIRTRCKTTIASSKPETAAQPPSTATSTAASSTSTTESGVPLTKTLTAMTLAILTVSTAAALVESSTASACPKFDPSGERFDQSTFIGRFSKMLLACDPRLLVYSEGEVRRCMEMVRGWEGEYELATGEEGELNRRLWEAQRVASAALHPDTGDSIPHPFRMSGYVPFNGPICVAMVASQSTPALLFFSWLNQSQNALVNYYNRNASSPMSNETLAKSYAAAVGSALVVAFGLATAIQKRFSPERAKNLLRWVAFPSSVVASSLNCYIVRSPEIDSGISLVDEHGTDVLPGETSKIAAERGVNLTTLSRAALQAPVFFLPPLLMSSLPPLANAVSKNPSLRVPVSTYLLLVCFGIGLPASVAIFPQTGEIRVEECEEKYRGLRDERGRGYEVLFYNKGL